MRMGARRLYFHRTNLACNAWEGQNSPISVKKIGDRKAPRQSCFDATSSEGPHDIPSERVVHKLRKRLSECALIIWRHIRSGLLCGKTMLWQIECNNRLCQ